MGTSDIRKAVGGAAWAVVKAQACAGEETSQECFVGLNKVAGDAAWAVVKAQASAGDGSSVDRVVRLIREAGALLTDPDEGPEDRVTRLIREAGDTVLVSVGKEFDESKVLRDEHGKFVKGASKASTAAAAVGHIVAGKVVSAQVYADLTKKLVAIKDLPTEEYKKARKKLESKAASSQRAKDFHARGKGNYKVPGAADVTPAHVAHEAALNTAIKVSEIAREASEDAASSKTAEDYLTAASAHEAARNAYMEAIKAESAVQGTHAMASLDSLINASNAHNDARDAAMKAAEKVKSDEALATAKPPANDFENPTAYCKWDPTGAEVNSQAATSPAMLNGVPLSHVDPGFWNTAKDIEVGEGPLPANTKVSSGCIVMEPDGRVWLVEPKDHFDSTNNTFPKGKMDASEKLSAQQNAMKEVYEESGLKVRIVGLMGDYKGVSGTTRYYIAHRVGGDPSDGMKAPAGGMVETQAVKLMTPTMASLSDVLNKPRDQKIIADLGEKLKAQPELLNQLHRPPEKSVGTTVFGKKTAEAAGSNKLGKSGFWTGTDGVSRYVKEYADPSQAHVEHLANQLYKDLGVKTPESMVFEHEGKTVYASKILEGGKNLGLSPTKAEARQVTKGFAADILTGNWDSIGHTGDNILKFGDGSVARIDNGGSLIFRAQGGKKSESQTKELSELKTFFDKGTNPSQAAILGIAGVGDAAAVPGFKQQVDRITKLGAQPGGWAKYVDDRTPGLAPKDRDQVVSMLDTRARLLKEASDAYEAAKPKGIGKPENTLSLKGAIDGGEHDAPSKALVSLVKGGSYVHSAAIKAADAAVGLSTSDRDSIKSLVSGWTGGYHGNYEHKQAYAAFADITAKGVPQLTAAPETMKAMGAALTGRSERWKAILEHAGVKDAEAPTHLDLSRGMRHAMDTIVDIAKAWKDPDASTVTIKHHAELASWSLGEKNSKEAFTGSNSVLLRWTCPMENTAADQVLDDGAFTSTFMHEHEVIAGPGHNDGLILPKEDHDVIYDGKTYKYDDREELFSALKKKGVKL